jgi:thiol-disulfide isomerase/thioredoxin
MALKEFFGETCPHCVAMKPLVEQLEKELGVTVEKHEVWNNEENAKEAEALDKGVCGGVPFFINTETNARICGSCDYEELKKWATG